ncbi:inositol-3-phosphate synthase [Solirubrum puertoriconensis]|uniref:inositol-3-phosphate synthase n=1 Tax=Solirubrum puertoriconensis TaxID=1751427 RepID=UPI00098E8A1E|nr:inositol-3-phosphate synthase [Solirubrum puertoriconensis]
MSLSTTPRNGAVAGTVTSRSNARSERVGVAVVGLGGAVASTAIAGVALMRAGAIGTTGLPLATLPAELTAQLADYGNLVFAGWDLCADDLATAARQHRVLEPQQLAAADAELSALRPWPAVGNARFCRNVTGQHLLAVSSHAAAVEAIRADLGRFKDEQQLERVVVVNLASTEAMPDLTLPLFATPEAFDEAVRNNDERIPPAMLYAYAAILEEVPYVNFTPSCAADASALLRLAEQRGVPVAGKDGKTGQTFMKTVLAPAFRARNLHVDGWFSTNILGNRDGKALDNPESLASKLTTKGSVLDQILGYKVDSHVVHIHYYQPRGDNKEAWDNIDVEGFLGQKMQIKVNFLCRDSILAAPLVLELVRLADLAKRRGEGGVVPALSGFFKSPMVPDAHTQPEHAFERQQAMLLDWLAAEQPAAPVAVNGAMAAALANFSPNAPTA